MAKKNASRKTKKARVEAVPMEVPKIEHTVHPSEHESKLFVNEEQKHHTFSHIMYVLFLIAVTFALFYTFLAFQVLGNFSNPEAMYAMMGVLTLLWAFMFWEFGHRIHQ